MASGGAKRGADAISGEVLDGRVVILTGASSGIGAGIARMLASNGAKLALGARRLEKLEEVRGLAAPTHPHARRPGHRAWVWRRGAPRHYATVHSYSVTVAAPPPPPNPPPQLKAQIAKDIPGAADRIICVRTDVTVRADVKALEAAAAAALGPVDVLINNGAAIDSPSRSFPPPSRLSRALLPIRCPTTAP